MHILCKVGKHNWDRCKCLHCGKLRDEGHDWRKDGEILQPDRAGVTLSQVLEKCATCGATRVVVDPKDMQQYLRESFLRRSGRR